MFVSNQARPGANGDASPSFRDKDRGRKGGKVPINKTCSAAQEEVQHTAAAKNAEDQRGLHQELQAEG